MKCTICGKKATNIHYSIIGAIPFHVCKKHFNETSPAMSWDWNGIENNNQRMGLIDKNNNYVELKYF